LRLRILLLAALAFLCVSVVFWLRRGPRGTGAVEYELAGHKFLLDERIRVLRAGEWGMGWTIRPGDWVLWVELENLPSEGDIILFRDPNGKLVAHRVLSTNPLRTGGDNSGPDNYPVEPLGIVIGVIYGV
jgi:hypothetical protein